MLLVAQILSAQFVGIRQLFMTLLPPLNQQWDPQSEAKVLLLPQVLLATWVVLQTQSPLPQCRMRTTTSPGHRWCMTAPTLATHQAGSTTLRPYDQKTCST
jgi:hypothetical protein